MNYKTYDEATEQERKRVYDQVISLAKNRPEAYHSHPRGWYSVTMVEKKPEPFTAVIRQPRKGEFYLYNNRWIQAMTDLSIELPVRVDKPRRARGSVATYDQITDDDLGRYVKLVGSQGHEIGKGYLALSTFRDSGDRYGIKTVATDNKTTWVVRPFASVRFL